jgi:DNA-binding transcriptional MerR regulator
MMKLLPLPDALASWRGSAKDLADKVNETLTGLTGSGTEEVNERLVRYYVQEGVLDPPEREGREAVFGFRQLVQVIAARFLLGDGWPLKKVAELVHTADVDSLLTTIPGARPRTRAEEEIAGFRRRPAAAMDSVHMSYSGMVRPTREPKDATALNDRVLALATEITQRRTALADNLRALGNDAGAPERKRTLRITLTPWCTVELDADKALSMDETTPEILGTALTQALQEERLKKGEKP